MGMEQTRQATILVVDDDEGNRKLLGAQLAAEGYAVRSAASGEEALASVAEQLPDLILLDIMMPGIDDFEVTLAQGCPSQPSHPHYPGDRAGGSRIAPQGAGGGDGRIPVQAVERAELLVRVRNLLSIKAINDFLAEHNRILEEQVCERTADERLTIYTHSI